MMRTFGTMEPVIFFFLHVVVAVDCLKGGFYFCMAENLEIGRIDETKSSHLETEINQKIISNLSIQTNYNTAHVKANETIIPKKDFFKSTSLLSLVGQIKNDECKTKIISLVEGLRNFSSWAVEMFDASSKLPSGIVSGNTYHFGNYDQCVNVFLPESSLRGKYCLAKIKFFLTKQKYLLFYNIYLNNDNSLLDDPYKSVFEKFKFTADHSKKQKNILHFGICIPDVCTENDAEILLKKLVKKKFEVLGYDVKINIPNGACTVKDYNKTLSIEGKILSTFILSFIFFVIFCSVCLRLNLFNEKIKRSLYIQSFCLSKNISKLSTQIGNGETNVFNGMKCMSMILVIMGHRCMASFGGAFQNPQFLEEQYKKFHSIILLNGTLIVDTFFLISGYLTFLNLFKQYERNKKMNALQIYLNRWLRMAPVYMLVVFFYAYIFQHIGSGPIWSMKVGREAERCRKNWWLNLLFINNYINSDSLCMFQSWYMTCDMHFIILAPVIVKLIVKSPKKGLLFLISVIIGSMLINFLVIYYNKYDGVLRVYITTLEDLATSLTFNKVYIKTHNRATPYYSGMAAAYVYFKLKQRHHKFSIVQIWIFSALSIFFGLFAIGGAWLFYIPGRMYNALENALYASLHRLLWAVSMSWIALAGGTKAFGIVEPVLSQKIFIPFSKLSYGAFLVHAAIQMYLSSTLRVPDHMSFFKLMWMTCGDVVLSFFLAFLLHIFFEAPLKGIQEVFFLDKSLANKNWQDEKGKKSFTINEIKFEKQK